MTTQRLGIIMNGVTGRMGTNQHLIRSILAIRNQGGVMLSNGDRVMPDPILVGRNAEKLGALAQRIAVERWTTDLDAALDDKKDAVFFDAATTQMRPELLAQSDQRRQARLLREADRHQPRRGAGGRDARPTARASSTAWCRTSCFCRACRSCGFLRDSGFFGRMLSVRGEFGYWVFEGDWQAAQRPSWNYRSEDGGGIILDMLCHWRYVLDNLFGEVKSVVCLGATHIPERWDERTRNTRRPPTMRPTPPSGSRAA